MPLEHGPIATNDGEPSKPPRRLLDGLRPLAIALPLYIYTWLGFARFLLPFSVVAQGAAIGLLTGWWLWRLLRRRGLPHTPLNGWLVAFLASAVLSTLLSVDQRLSVDTLLDILACVLVFFLLCDLLLEKWPSRVLVDAVLWFCTFMLIQSVWVVGKWYWEWYALRVPGYPVWPVPFGRIMGVAQNPHLLVAIVNLALPFAIMRLDRTRSLLARSFWCLWLAVLDVVLVYTGSKGGWLGAITAVGITVWWLLSRHGSPRRGLVVSWLRKVWRLCVAVMAYLVLFVLAYACNPRTMTIGSVGPDSFFLTTAAAVTTGRDQVWRVGILTALRSPLAGNGLWSFAREYVNVGQDLLPTATTHKHAHNALLNVLAEQGLVGAAALLGLVVVAFRALARGALAARGRGEDNEGVAVAVASVATLAGQAVQSQVDVNTWLPAIAVLLVVITVVGLHDAGAVQHPTRPASRWLALALALPCVLALLFQGQNRANESILRAYEAWWRGDRRAAVAYIDAAIAADPSLTFYQEQRANVYAAQSESGSQVERAAAREEALLSYRVALDDGPQWGPSLLNQAILAERSGHPGAFEAGVAPWLSRWGLWPLPHLLLAEQYATQGREAEAKALLTGILRRFPASRALAACRSSEVCRSVADALPRPESPSAVWFARAQAHLASGEIAEARYCARAARALGHSTYAVDVLDARIHLAEGQVEEAADTLLELLRPALVTGSYDMVFRRLGLGAQLPSLILLERTSDHLEAYRLLAELDDAQGLAQEAAALRADADVLERLLAGESAASAGIAVP